MCICRLLTVPGKIHTPHGTVRRHPYYMPLDQFVDEGVSDRETQPKYRLSEATTIYRIILIGAIVSKPEKRLEYCLTNLRAEK